MSEINPYIEQYVPKDYGGTLATGCLLDCGQGVDYKPIPDAVMERLAKLPAGEIKHYPHSEPALDALEDALLQRCRPAAPLLTAENLYFGCGSFDILCALNLLYANSQKKIMGHAPQFTAYVDHVHCLGAQFVTYPLDRAHSYAFHGRGFADMIRREKPALVCCENPNNPTGQAANDLMDIVTAARDAGAAVVFDEAYGDYLPREMSALPYVSWGEENGVDVFVTRTFSKGYGMAGMRLGYVLGPKYALTQLKKFLVPFNGSALAKNLALAMLEGAPGWADALGPMTRKANEYLYPKINALGKYHIAETSLYTPICALYVDDPETDLCQALGEVGLAVVSCATYENMGKNAVRVMLCEDLDLLVELLAKAKV